MCLSTENYFICPVTIRGCGVCEHGSLFYSNLFSVINCGSPSIPVNTKLVRVSSTSYLGTAVYKCNSGYKMSTNDTSICQSNRQWSTLYCTGMLLLIPELPWL